jgi:hypothetical protein
MTTQNQFYKTTSLEQKMDSQKESYWIRPNWQNICLLVAGTIQLGIGIASHINDNHTAGYIWDSVAALNLSNGLYGLGYTNGHKNKQKKEENCMTDAYK